MLILGHPPAFPLGLFAGLAVFALLLLGGAGYGLYRLIRWLL